MNPLKNKVLKLDENEMDYFAGQLFNTEAGEKLLNCIQCGTCSGSCPTVKAWAITPRQVVRLLQLGKKEEILRPEVIYFCSQCYACKVRCPMGIRLTDVLIELRCIAVQKGLGPLEPQTALVKSVRNYENPWMQPRASRDRWAKKLRLDIIPRRKAEVLYYPGCTAAFVPSVQKVAVSTARLFQHLGVDFGILGRDERCCGSTALRVGEKELYREVALKNIRQFNECGVQTIVTACAGCFGVIKHEYPKLAPLQPEVLHLSEYLLRLCEEGRLRFPAFPLRVTYHDPCHLGRHGGVFDAPRRILSRIPELELLEMERIREHSRCCGAGGGVRTAHAPLAGELAASRIEEALHTGAEALVTCCPFCEQNLGELLNAAGGPMRLYDLVELVVQILKLEEKDEGRGVAGL